MFVFATFNSGAQVLTFTKKNGQKFSFQLINWVTNLKPGLGYIQEMHGRFDEYGRLDVVDLHDDQVSDFELQCGRYPEGVRMRNDDVRPTAFMQTNSGFPRPIDDNIMIRVFAGPPPKTVKYDYGTIWITDPNMLILKHLSESEMPLSVGLDQTHDVQIGTKQEPDWGYVPPGGKVTKFLNDVTLGLYSPPPMKPVPILRRHVNRRRVIVGIPFKVM